MSNQVHSDYFFQLRLKKYICQKFNRKCRVIRVLDYGNDVPFISTWTPLSLPVRILF